MKSLECRVLSLLIESLSCTDIFLINKKRLWQTRCIASGTSIGTNIAESINAQSEADFISKLSIALKEANETEYWLGRIYHAGFIYLRGHNSMKADNDELYTKYL